MSQSTLGVDPLVLGRRIRFLRSRKQMSLDDLGAVVGRAASGISAIENGHRVPTLAQLSTLATVLGVSARDLLDPDPPTARDAAEIEWERFQRSHEYIASGLPQVRVSRTTPPEVLGALLGLVRELHRLRDERVATPEEARRANAALRLEQRAGGGYFPDLEVVARKLVELSGRDVGQPMGHRHLAEMTKRLGFTVVYADDCPTTTRSVLDLRGRRIYLPKLPDQVTGDHRSALLQAMAGYVLEHHEPSDYKAFLRQRVEANYLAAAVLMPEAEAVPCLTQAKAERRLSMEGFRDQFTVSFEMAAHRFVNLATRHLGIEVHFAKVHSGGVIHKVYENDGMLFPVDPLGAIEGQFVCRYWTGRTAFEAIGEADRYAQYTDTPAGTFWDTSHIKRAKDGVFSISVGCRFDDARYFEGRATRHRMRSGCPDPNCCQVPPPDLAEAWKDAAWPSARPHSSVLTAMPAGAFPGVDMTDVYEFLERHAN
ncbi:MAG: helix-turn-helix domain-containing protein [Bifidobacteriaceae bacterium]|jgi:transcriptional regulator with XRE-family HTH domain/predicted transcriptional regulator|nr:helix-turn-helix domain-containing protein [Bifidobacteriaceae bacterium]